MAENENDLQILLDILSVWCKNNKLHVNEAKSNIIHYRTPSIPRKNFNFSCCGNMLDITDRYNYLGLLLREFPDLNIIVGTVAKSVSRVLGLVIYECKMNGGLSFQCFTKLYDSLVWLIIYYGSSIWGTSKQACIEASKTEPAGFILDWLQSFLFYIYFSLSLHYFFYHDPL